MKSSRRRLSMLIGLLAVLSMLLVACGGDDDDDSGDVGDDSPVATATQATEVEATATQADEAEATPPPEVEEASGDAAAGEGLWQAQCMACHSIDGSEGLGPTWQGLWMSDVTLEDGSTVTADEAYITESILEPNAKVHEGFMPVMPEFNLSDDEIANVIAFIQTLE